MAPEDDDFEEERFSELAEDATLDYEDTEHAEGDSHSESIYIVDDEEAGRESFARTTSATLDYMALQAQFAEDVATPFVDADPTARDAQLADPVIPGPAAAAAEAPRDDVARRHLRGLLEALLFVSERPMKAADLAEIARADTKEVRSVLEALSEEYRADSRGFQLDELAGGFQLRTSAAYAPFVRDLTQAKPVRLSRAQVETLAIIAYRQPITRPEIEDIRGVDAGAVLKLLLDRDMIRVLGKKDEPGRPLLYGTTTHFLTFFGLKTLKDLPTLREFSELTDESREVVERELGEVLPDGPREPPPNIVGDASVASAEYDPMVPPGEPTSHRPAGEVRTTDEALAEERAAELGEAANDALGRAKREAGGTAPANDADDGDVDSEFDDEDSEFDDESDEDDNV